MNIFKKWWFYVGLYLLIGIIFLIIANIAKAQLGTSPFNNELNFLDSILIILLWPYLLLTS